MIGQPSAVATSWAGRSISIARVQITDMQRNVLGKELVSFGLKMHAKGGGVCKNSAFLSELDKPRNYKKCAKLHILHKIPVRQLKERTSSLGKYFSSLEHSTSFQLQHLCPSVHEQERCAQNTSIPGYNYINLFKCNKSQK